MTVTPEPAAPGVWPSQWIMKAIESGLVVPEAEFGADRIDESTVQPASLDLRLGPIAYRLRCSFLPGKNDTVTERLRSFKMGPPIDLTQGAILERNRPYLIPLQEGLRLPRPLRARANPKSSTGRVDVFTRVITDRSSRYDDIIPGYRGPLYLEVVPRSFTVMVQTGLALNQLRLVTGDTRLSDDQLRELHNETPLLYYDDTVLDRRDVRINDGLFMSLDIAKRDEIPVGYRAKRNSDLIDLSKVDYYDTADYWDPVVPEKGNRVVLEPEEFYLLLSAEAIRIPPSVAAEMTAFDPSSGELRTHYAGFFDPGFGHDPDGVFNGSRAALEVRAHDVAFAMENRRRVVKLTFERMAEECTTLYGAGLHSHYQGQRATLSKHFKVDRGPLQLELAMEVDAGGTRRPDDGKPRRTAVVQPALLTDSDADD